MDTTTNRGDGVTHQDTSVFNSRIPQVGERVLFFANSGDDSALTNGNKMGDPIPALVTRPWSSICCNLKIFPDYGPVHDKGSVSHKSAMPAGGGYYWMFPEEFYKADVSNGEAEQKEILIKHMVDRFLSWKLPEDFNPDGGISFRKMFNENTEHPMKSEPIGTNLFTAAQAEDMIRHLLSE